MKYAKLASGKILEFPDDISEKEMQRRVRREMGLIQEDLIDAIENLSHQIRDQARLQDVVSSFAAEIGKTSKTIGKELGDSVKALTAASDKTGKDLGGQLGKAVGSLGNLIVTLNVAVDALNKTLDAAMGQSLDGLDRAIDRAADMQAGMKAHVGALKVIADQISAAAKVMDAASRMRRKATMVRDGEWVLAPDRTLS